MLKKILCLCFTLLMMAGITCTAASAAQTDVAEAGADSKLYFEVPSDWKNYKYVYCHIWEHGAPTPLASFQSKKEKCTLEEDGRYSYDFSAVGGLEAGKYYGVLFSVDTMMQTYDTIMTTDCLGDTLYCNDTVYENPKDSNRTCRAAFFRNQDPSVYGPLMQITSIGNLIGTCLPSGTTAADLFSGFLTEKLENARTYSGKTDQNLIDDMAKGLGLSQDSVEKLIADSGITVDWKKAESKAPVEDKPITPASPGAVSTGQGMSVVYTSASILALSACVILIVRRKLKICK